MKLNELKKNLLTKIDSWLNMLETPRGREIVRAVTLIGIILTLITLFQAKCHTNQINKTLIGIDSVSVDLDTLRLKISSIVALNAYRDFEELLIGLREMLTKANVDSAGGKPDTVLIALDWVGYGHFSYPDIYYGEHGIFQKLRSLSLNKRVKILTLNILAQKTYLETKFIPPFLRTRDNRDTLYKKLEGYLKASENREALGRDTLTLDSLKDNKYFQNVKNERLIELLTNAILKTEMSIRHNLRGIDSLVIDTLRYLPIDVVVYSKLNVGFMAMHIIAENSLQDYHSIKIVGNELAIKGLKGTWYQLAASCKDSIVQKR